MEKVEVAEAMHHDDDGDDDDGCEDEDEREGEGRGEDDGSIGSSADWPIDWDTEPEGDERDYSSEDDFLNQFFGHGRYQEHYYHVWEELAEDMANDSTPETAVLSEFLFQGDIAAQFAGYLAKNSSLKTARFMGCDFADDAIDGGEMIADAISRNTCLERLHLHQCTVGLRGISALSKGAGVSETLTLLDMYQTGVGPPEVAAIVEGLSGTRSLTALGIRRSDVLDQGATSISNFLRGNTSVTDLNIERSKIGDAGLHAICEALVLGKKKNKNLTNLVLSDNCVSGNGVNSIIMLLEYNQTLQFIDLPDMPTLDYLDMQDLAEALRTTPRRHHLRIEGISLGAAWESIGLPRRCKHMENCEIVQIFDLAWRKKLLAVAMGFHQRLGGGRDGGEGACLFQGLESSVCEMIGMAVWGLL